MKLKDGENLYLVAYRSMQMSIVLEAFMPGIGKFVGFTELFIFNNDITCVDTMLYNDSEFCKVTFIYNLTTQQEIYNITNDLDISVVKD